MAPGPRWILHVDMDAFFASVEALDDPSLVGRPVIVGGSGSRGVVASCSYEARVFGVRSAMPSVQARRLCPEAVFVAGRYDRYAEVSREMHAVFQRFTPLVEGISLDEAFLDVSGSIRLFGPPAQIARSIREQIRTGLGLTCSVGAAPVKFLAKLASEAAKPRVDRTVDQHAGGTGSGVYVVERGQELAFLHPLPIDALWGVGPATARRLGALGFATIGDLAAVDPTVLERAVGRAHGRHLANLARGIDDRGVEADRPVKSVSHEETYATDRRDPDGLRVEVLRMSDSVASRLRRSGVAGRTVTLKVRYGDFSTHTRSETQAGAIDSGPVIAAVARRLLDAVDLAPGVRLLGVGVSNLVPAGSGPGEQLSLDLLGGDAAAPPGPPPVQPTHPVPSTHHIPPTRPIPSAQPDPPAKPYPSAVVDAIRRRFGAGAVGPAALVDAGRLRVKRTGDSQWGPGGTSRPGPTEPGPDPARPAGPARAATTGPTEPGPDPARPARPARAATTDPADPGPEPAGPAGPAARPNPVAPLRRPNGPTGGNPAPTGR
ncbi:MAG TPA: DNA polymerase IV [Acidimicrobiales bacterium]|nr:DNA polymerase IV [Acidimicrobiales bacterium]